MSGKIPEIEDLSMQIKTLEPLARFLELEGWSIRLGTKDGEVDIPLSATSESGRQIAVGTYPVLLEQNSAVSQHALLRGAQEEAYILSDYLVQNDLPIAYQTVSDPSRVSKPSGIKKKPKNHKKALRLPLMVMGDFLSGNKIPSRLKDFFVTDGANEFFAVEVDSHDLSAVDACSGDALILKPYVENDIISRNKYLLRKRVGSFNSTEKAVTIANLKFVDIGEKSMLQVSYAKPEKHFRPERIGFEDVEILAELMEIIPREN